MVKAADKYAYTPAQLHALASLPFPGPLPQRVKVLACILQDIFQLLVDSLCTSFHWQSRLLADWVLFLSLTLHLFDLSELHAYFPGFPPWLPVTIIDTYSP